MLRSAGRSPTDRSPIRPGQRPVGRGQRRQGAGDAGFILIEVIISALLVGLIVVATFTGFDVVNRVSADQRQHSQAAALAAQSQEQLRSLPATSLLVLKASPHSYTQTIGGTVYTVKQSAELQGAGGSNATCSVTETERQSGNSFRITSTVSWAALKIGSQSSVVASSLVTPPTGSGLEVDANNDPVPTAGISGVTAVVKYTPVGSGSIVSLQQTTGSEGCVVFGGIPSTAATVEIPEISGFVVPSGASKVQPKEIKVAPNYTTHYAVTYNRGGAIAAQFAYNGLNGTKGENYEHANNEGKAGAVKELPKGDTFVSWIPLMSATPNFELGSTRYLPPTAVYNPVPGEHGTYESQATSPSILFPFALSEAEKGSWQVYAGDCPENNPETVTGGTVKPPEKIVVTAGATTNAVVPMTYVTVNLYKGTEALAKSEGYKNLETGTAWPVTITNVKCAGVTPNNESPLNVKHTQWITTGAENGGHLENPFQPFASELQLCVAGPSNKLYTRVFANSEVPPKGPVLPIYLAQKSLEEREANKAAAVAAEKTTKTNRETTEANERKAWEALEKAKPSKMTNAERKANEAKQEKTRNEVLIPAEKATETARLSKEAEEAKEAKESKVVVEKGEKCP